MVRSKVKWFDSKKGFGFILHPDGGDDIFVHFSHIVSDSNFKILYTNSVVDFELDKSNKRLQARQVRKIVDIYDNT
jgi:CspA family cold shock protein